MKAKLANALSFSDVISAVENFMPEVNIVAIPDGIKIYGVDTAKVAFISIFLPASYFQEYSIEGEKELIGVKVGDLSDVLKRADKEDELEINNKENKLMIKFNGNLERKFVLPLLSLEEGREPTLNFQFSYRAKMTTNNFAEALGVLSEIGGVLILQSKDTNLILQVEGDMSNAKVEFSVSGGSLIEADGVDARSSYSMEYVLGTTTLRKSADIIEISFGTEIPVKLHYEMPNGAYGDFYVAPRAE
ncbi:hypothetical protein [Sulfuracidifex metallicus]|uniref:DNA polymerase sliding clamp n=1 Tax=Sulfuracidifex metallicus DSM 6482 = JCM 9184 TaxID=523847 RepID=A0A6A9QY77_SULME|nr:hypothetical protein [Sulfuracidifex metallicus]MUN29962.1 DNA polymerase sliding clamp [Sulfuracidifex metallicus DSM 6482 = JCM 9184]WOE51655.1 DNA polymerase sliding clamp [Sulfuracidifex metallicus DSM 6482 = JCM 9184]